MQARCNRGYRKARAEARKAQLKKVGEVVVLIILICVLGIEIPF